MCLTVTEVHGKGHECVCRGPSHGRTVRAGRVGTTGLPAKSLLLWGKRRLWPLLEAPAWAGTPRAGRGTLVIPTLLLLSSKPLSG